MNDQRMEPTAEIADQEGLTRRKFFKLAGMAAAGGAAGLMLPRGLQAAAPKNYTAAISDCIWDSIRKEFILDPQKVYMNIGTTGAMPRRVLNRYTDYNTLAARRPKTFEDEIGASFGLTAQRETLAAQFGCNADEICLTRNTTDGMDAIVYGLDFTAGDEILITHHEHIAALSPLNVIQDRYGVVITEVEIPVLASDFLAHEIPDRMADAIVMAFRQAIGPKTKAILFSHITYKTGTRLPAKALCALAREYGLISIVDGAHGPGMIQLDFHDMDCDFYAGPGHKWQCGPGATGILYLRNHGDDLPGFWTQNSSLYTFAVQPFGNVRGNFDIAYSLQYRGQLNIPAHLAMLAACDMWEEIGRDRIETYVCGLSAYLKASLKERFGNQGTLFSPDVPDFSTGLTAFNPFDDITDSDRIKGMVDRLDDAGYQVRYTNFRVRIDDKKDAYALRISTHLFHSPAHVNGLVDALYDVYAEMAS